MAVFSTNQNRQLYVVAGLQEDIASLGLGEVTTVVDQDGHVRVVQKGNGGLVASDLINPKSIMWTKLSSKNDTAIKLKGCNLSLKSTVNSGNPIEGEDYIVRINFRQMYGMSDEDIYQKYGAVHAVSGMTPANFYKEMIYSLKKNFSRLYSPLLVIGVNSSSNIVHRATKVNGTVKLYKEDGTEISTSPTSIFIGEQSQTDEWALGTKQYTPVYFDVIPTTVKNGQSGEVEWGDVTAQTTYDTVPNGYKFADLEYFCMGERADQYRNVGWPKSIPTKYFANPTAQYYCFDIHYAFQGSCEDIQKSEKTITFIAEDVTDLVSLYNSITGEEYDTDTPPAAATKDFNDEVKVAQNA